MPTLRFMPLAATLLAAVPIMATPAGAAGYRRHYAASHHRHARFHEAGGHVAPAFAPPSPVEAGPFGLSGPQLPGLPGGGGVLGTGLSDGRGLLGIGFLGL